MSKYNKQPFLIMLYKLSRISILVTILILLFGSLINFSLNVFINSRAMKRNICVSLRGHFQREVKLGSISINFLKGIRIRDFSVSEYPDFRKGKYLEIKDLLLGVKFISIFKHKINITYIKLDSPEINIINSEVSKFNFAGAVAGVTKGLERINRKRAIPFEFSVSRLKIRNGVIDFGSLSKDKNVKTKIKNFELASGNISIDKPFEIAISFIEANGDFQSHADISCNYLKRNIEIKNISISDEKGKELNVRGRIEEIFSKSNHRLNLTLQGNRYLLNKFIGYFGINEVMFGSGENVNFVLSGNLSSFEISFNK